MRPFHVQNGSNAEVWCNSSRPWTAGVPEADARSSDGGCREAKLQMQHSPPTIRASTTPDPPPNESLSSRTSTPSVCSKEQGEEPPNGHENHALLPARDARRAPCLELVLVASSIVSGYVGISGMQGPMVPILSNNGSKEGSCSYRRHPSLLDLMLSTKAWPPRRYHRSVAKPIESCARRSRKGGAAGDEPGLQDRGPKLLRDRSCEQVWQPAHIFPAFILVAVSCFGSYYLGPRKAPQASIAMTQPPIKLIAPAVASPRLTPISFQGNYVGVNLSPGHIALAGLSRLGSNPLSQAKMHQHADDKGELFACGHIVVYRNHSQLLSYLSRP